METFQFLELCRKFDARIGGAKIQITSSNQKRWAELCLDSEMHHEADAIESAIETVKAFVPSGQIALTASSLNLETGRVLLDMVAELKTTLERDEARVVDVK